MPEPSTVQVNSNGHRASSEATEHDTHFRLLSSPPVPHPQRGTRSWGSQELAFSSVSGMAELVGLTLTQEPLHSHPCMAQLA